LSDLPIIRLSGAPNFRDLGGYATQDGRIVKHGLLFRSGDSSGLTAADIGKLEALGAKLVVDLRSERESAANEIRWPLGRDTEFIAANILADLRAGNQSVIELLTGDPTPRGAANMMETTYRVLPHALGPTLLQIARRIVEADKLPVIFHCTVGRDRAGITAAMLLYALGVPRDIVIADYLRTNVHVNAQSIRDMTQLFITHYKTTLDQETLDILTFARIEHFHAAMRIVAVEYGTVDDYLRAIGIDDDLQTRLRERLLEPA
jgi:protein-tyrosine phosphatase